MSHTKPYEWSALATECLDRRIPDEETLRGEITAWEEDRNSRDTSVEWQFTTDDARKLNQLCPVSENE
jgi:predicted AAA+ superfamily ATPase